MGVDEARAEYLVGLVRRHADKDSSILEVGSREGANLISLGREGFKDLYGVEGDSKKVRKFRETCPLVEGFVEVMEGPERDLLAGMDDGEYDVVFTVGFLFDKDGDNSWLPGEMARLSRSRVIVIEDETGGSPRGEFESLGLVEVEEAELGSLSELESVFRVRVFEVPG
jgi:hypothetical protein